MIKFYGSAGQLFEHVYCAHTDRRGGLSQGSYADLNLAAHVGDRISRVTYHRALFKQALQQRFSSDIDIPYLSQVHGNTIVEYNHRDNNMPMADGIYTSRTDVALAIMSADCMPVMLSDGEIIMALHAGWRGLAQGIIVKAIDHFSIASAVKVWIGPHICQQHFEVGEEVVNHFSHYPQAIKASPNNNKYLLDMAYIARQQLQDLGVESIFNRADCSYQSPFLYSHRRASHENKKHTGRNVSFIIKAKI